MKVQKSGKENLNREKLEKMVIRVFGRGGGFLQQNIFTEMMIRITSNITATQPIAIAR
jgi:hypothetical protein